MIQLQRYDQNPILAPTDNWWECKAVFNPAAVYDGQRVHILYRAIGEDNISRFGYASSENGFEITYRSELPVFEPEHSYELDGLVPNVVFACGTAEIDGDLLVYYGGADKVVGVAKANKDEFLAQI